MKICLYGEEPDLQLNSAVTIGKFDGLHLGHQELILETVRKKKESLSSVVVSFYNESSDKKSILSRKESISMLENMGVDMLYLLPICPEIMQMEAEDFLKKILLEKLQMRFVFCGKDFCFGHERKGNAALLEKLQEQYGYTLKVFDKKYYAGEEISSSRIRKLMENGEIEDANACLGHSYAIDGVVSHGKELGRKLGFPTINVYPAEEKILPKFGVYYTKVLMDGKIYGGLANLGVKPSVTDERKPLLETHLLNASGDFYGKEVVCYLESFIRPEMKFESIQELEARVNADIQEAKIRHLNS